MQGETFSRPSFCSPIEVDCRGWPRRVGISSTCLRCHCTISLTSCPLRRYMGRPDLRWWSHHTVSKRVSICDSSRRKILPRYVSCRREICFLIVGILYNFSRIEVFVMCCSITSLILIFDILLIPLCRNTLREARRDFLKDQLLQPHRSRLQGMALKSRYFEYVSTLSSSHILDIAPIEAFAEDILFMMS